MNIILLFLQVPTLFFTIGFYKKIYSFEIYCSYSNTKYNSHRSLFHCMSFSNCYFFNSKGFQRIPFRLYSIKRKPKTNLPVVSPKKIPAEVNPLVKKPLIRAAILKAMGEVSPLDPILEEKDRLINLAFNTCEKINTARSERPKAFYGLKRHLRTQYNLYLSRLDKFEIQGRGIIFNAHKLLLVELKKCDLQSSTYYRTLPYNLQEYIDSIVSDANKDIKIHIKRNDLVCNKTLTF